MADIALLSRLITCIEHDNDHSAATDEVQPVARTVVNSHLGNFTINWLPISKTSSFCLPQAGRDADLSAFVLQRVEPRDEFFGLADSEHASTVAKWILTVKREAAWCAV